jgi:hypothetical protein
MKTYNFSFLLIMLIFLTINIRAQTIPCDKFFQIVELTELQDIIANVETFGFKFQGVFARKAGEKGLSVASKAVYWSYNCNYDNTIDIWTYKSNNWSYFRLVLIEDTFAIFDLVVNETFYKNYISNFKLALKNKGFSSKVSLDQETGRILTTFTKDDYNSFIIFVIQSSDKFIIRFTSLSVKL